jgi:hypothetical protein
MAGTGTRGRETGDGGTKEGEETKGGAREGRTGEGASRHGAVKESCLQASKTSCSRPSGTHARRRRGRAVVDGRPTLTLTPSGCLGGGTSGSDRARRSTLTRRQSSEGDPRAVGAGHHAGRRRRAEAGTTTARAAPTRATGGGRNVTGEGATRRTLAVQQGGSTGTGGARVVRASIRQGEGSEGKRRGAEVRRKRGVLGGHRAPTAVWSRLRGVTGGTQVSSQLQEPHDTNEPVSWL